MVANADLPTSSGYTSPVKAFESDCDLNEGQSVSAISDSARFRLLAEDWRRNTRYRSDITRAILHPSYVRIIKMREAALPFIFRELEEHGGHWYWALQAITEQTVGDSSDNLTTARAKWLEWGRANGYLRA